MKFLKSPGCADRPYACWSKLQFDQFNIEIQYIYKVFHAIYQKFLTTIDHIDYHPSQQHVKNKTRVKRSEILYIIWTLPFPNQRIDPF